MEGRVSAAPLLSLQAVGRSFGGLAAVSDLSFDIAPGEICGLIGPNGAGKSTTFDLIAGTTAPSAGRLVFVGRDITGTESHAVARLGIARMFQGVHLFESMTIGSNILVGADRHDHLGFFSGVLRLPEHRRQERTARARAAAAAAMLGLEPLLVAPVAGLPVGQQRLVAVARALAAQPRLLLLDEPAAGLSPPEIDALAQAVRQAHAAGVTVLVVEHNIDFVLGLCDHVVVMHEGRKIADGSPAEVRASAAVREAYLGT
jgi:ABC-type branched-subunit amino acid transport system ATPase component